MVTYCQGKDGLLGHEGGSPYFSVGSKIFCFLNIFNTGRPVKTLPPSKFPFKYDQIIFLKKSHIIEFVFKVMFKYVKEIIWQLMFICRTDSEIAQKVLNEF